MDIGDRIRAARRKAGLSQEEVARRADMSLKGMGDIERGDIADPHYSSLRKIADALSVPIGELLEGEPVVSGPKAQAPPPPDVGGRGEEERSAYRPRYNVPGGKPAETVEEVFGGGYPPPTVEEVLEEVYGRWEKHVDRFVDWWAQKLEAGNFTLDSIDACWAAIENYSLDLGELNRREKQVLPPQPDAYGLPAARTGRAIYRLNDLIGPLHDAVRSKFGESELEKMRRRRAETEALLGEAARRTG